MPNHDMCQTGLKGRFRDCCVALPRGAMGFSAVCDCGISGSYSLTIFEGKGAKLKC